MTWDPASTEAGLTFGDLNQTGIFIGEPPLIGFPERRTSTAQSPDGDGADIVSTKYGNRVIVLPLRIQATQAAFPAYQHQVMRMVEQAKEDGGELEITAPQSGVVTYDVVGASLADFEVGRPLLNPGIQDFQVTFEVKPYGRLAVEQEAAVSETDDPILVYDITSISGNATALGQLTLEAPGANNLRWLVWGLGTTHHFVGGEDMTMLNSTAAAVGPAGAHGAAANKTAHKDNVPTSWTELVSTGTLNLPGLYRAFCRAQCPTANSDDMSLRLHWSIGGQFVLYEENATATIADDSAWHIIDLGVVSATPPFSGNVALECRIAAKGAASTDDIDIDWLVLIPADHGFGELSADTSASDAVIFTGQSAVVRHDGAFRENSGGTAWGPVANRSSDPLLVHPGNSQLIVLWSRGVQPTEADSSIEDLEAALDCTPRTLYLPES